MVIISIFLLWKKLDFSFYWFSSIFPFLILTIPYISTWYFCQEARKLKINIVSFVLLSGFSGYYLGIQPEYWEYNFLYLYLLMFFISSGVLFSSIVTRKLKTTPLKYKKWKKILLESTDEIEDYLDIIVQTIVNSIDFELEEIWDHNNKKLYSLGGTYRLLIISNKRSICIFCFERLGRYIEQGGGCLNINEKIKFTLKNLLNFTDVDIHLTRKIYLYKQMHI